MLHAQDKADMGTDHRGVGLLARSRFAPDRLDARNRRAGSRRDSH
jgi:hypothetical protein